ncbi:hypothetical protein ABW19_dt0205131 [Dactylella cylindrospora]|nr:hypothetical protein ABW19_dt0205131 [Dactylella cylindrospora]
MPKFYPTLSDHLTNWALSQPLFFTATAPLSGKHVNLSPKGLPTSCLSIPNPSTILYLDATGSGVETISHLYENGRITIMFTSFEATPRIMRLFCRGRVVEKGTPEYESLVKKMGTGDKSNGAGIPTARAIIYCDIQTVQTSCGYGVPLFLEGKWEDRKTLNYWGSKTVAEGKLEEYQAENNRRSLDGLPGLRNARRRKGEWMKIVEGWRTILRVWGYLAFFLMGVFVGIVIMSSFGEGGARKIWSLEGKGFTADW